MYIKFVKTSFIQSGPPQIKNNDCPKYIVHNVDENSKQIWKNKDDFIMSNNLDLNNFTI